MHRNPSGKQRSRIIWNGSVFQVTAFNRLRRVLDQGLKFLTFSGLASQSLQLVKDLDP
jgi:hypothetical protein